MLLVLTVVLSVSAISASEVNVTDSYATNLVDDTSDVSVPLENSADSSNLSVSSDSNVDNDPSKVSLSSEEVLESDSSNTLSTNVENDTTNLSSTNDNQKVAGSNRPIYLTVSSSSVYYKGTLKVTLKNEYNKGYLNVDNMSIETHFSLGKDKTLFLYSSSCLSKYDQHGIETTRTSIPFSKRRA